MGIKKKHVPGCTCCACSLCKIASDEFTRADSSSLGADWTEVAGGWEITSGTLSTTDDDATVNHTTTHDESYIVTVRIKGNDAGDQLEVHVGKTDEDNYSMVRVTLENATLGLMELIEVVAGVETVFESTYVANLVQDVWHTLRVCLDGDTLTGEITTASGSTRFIQEDGFTQTADTVGLGTKTVTTRVWFDNFCWQRHYEGNDANDSDCKVCNPDDCTFAEDDFNRSNSTDLTAAWEELSGNWEINTNVLKIATAPAYVRHTVPQGMLENKMIVTVRFRCEDDGDKVRVLAAMNNANDWIGAEFEVDSGGCGVMRIFEAVAGVVTQKGIDVPVTNLVPDEWHTASVCYGDGTHAGTPSTTMLTAHIEVAEGQTRTYSVSEAHGTFVYSGLGVTAVTTKVEFDDFSVDYSGDADYAPDCPECGYDGRLCSWLNPEGDMSCDWEQVAGTWTDFETSDASATLKCKIPHPYGDNKSMIRTSFSSTADGDELLLYVSYKDASTYLAARLTIDGTCGSVELIQNGSVLQILYIEPLDTNTSHYVCVSYDGSTLRASVAPEVGDAAITDKRPYTYRHIAASVTGSSDGIYVAIGTGSLTGTAGFGSPRVSVAYHPAYYPDCITCDTCHLSEFWDGNGVIALPADVTQDCEWDISSGTVADASGGVKISTANGYAGYKGNDGSTNAYAEVYLNGTVTNQTLRVYINDDGSLTGPWAEVEFKDAPNTTVLRLSTGQTSTFPIRPNTTHLLTICLNGTALYANLDPNAALTPPVVAAAQGTTTASTGRYLVCQLRTTNGDAYFQNVKYKRLFVPKEMPDDVQSVDDNAGELAVDCADCYTLCTCCKDSVLPPDMLVEIEGLTCIPVVWIPPCCPDCCSLTTEFEGGYIATASSSCTMTYDVDNGVSDAPCWLRRTTITVEICPSLAGYGAGCGVSVAAGFHRIIVTISYTFQVYGSATATGYSARYVSEPIANGTNCLTYNRLPLERLHEFAPGVCTQGDVTETRTSGAGSMVYLTSL